MTDKARIKVAVLMTALLLGGTSAAAALTHQRAAVVPATSRLPSAHPAQPAIPHPTTDRTSND
jgi:hypothetical protein